MIQDAIFVVKHQDGTYSGYPVDGSANSTSSATHIYGNNRQGMRIRFDGQVLLQGVYFDVTKVGTPSDLEVVLYESGNSTALATATVDQALYTSGFRRGIAFFDSVSVAAGTDLYIVLKQAGNGGDASNYYYVQGLPINGNYVSAYLAGDNRFVRGTGDDPATYTDLNNFVPYITPIFGDPSAANLGGNPLRYFDVTDYGATGDGTTDDTAAIQAAMDAAEAAGAGSTVFFPRGTYIVTPASGDVALTFAGDDSTITGTGIIKLMDASAAEVILNVTGARNVISGIQIVGNETGAPTGEGIGLQITGHYNVVRDVYIHNMSDHVTTGGQCLEVTGDHNLVVACWLEHAHNDAVLDSGDFNTYRSVTMRDFNKNGLRHTGDGKTRIDLDRCYLSSTSNNSDVVPIRIAPTTNPLESAYLSNCIVGELDNAGTANSRGASFEDVNLLVLQDCEFIHARELDSIRFDGDVKVAHLARVFASRTIQGNSTGQRFERLLLDSCVIGNGTQAPLYAFNDLDAENFAARDCNFVGYSDSALLWVTAAANYDHLEASNCVFQGTKNDGTTYDVKKESPGELNTSGKILWLNNRRENTGTGTAGAQPTVVSNERIFFATRDASKRVLESSSSAQPPTTGLNWSQGDVTFVETPGSGTLKMGYVRDSSSWKAWGDVQ